jgi:hypothetical protein
VHYPSTKREVSFFGRVKPPHRGYVRVRILKLRSDGSVRRLVSEHAPLSKLGRFTFDFRVSRSGAGLYKAVAKFPGDGDHTVAKSRELPFMIGP